MKKLIFICILGYILTNISNSYGQSISLPEITMPPPEAAGLSSQAVFDVSYYMGIANISIPIYTIKDKDLVLPITLDYTGSGGIQVSEEASWIGLGWNLNCTGVITRQVRGKDDLLNQWFYPELSKKLPDDPSVNSNTRTRCDGTTYLETFSEEPPYAHLPADDECVWVSGHLLDLMVDGVRTHIGLDSEGIPFYDYSSDIYNISIPGFSGQFMFDTNNNPVFLKPNGNRIEWYKEETNIVWKMTNNRGVIYLFRNRSYTKTKSLYNSGYSTTGIDNISAWNLTEIISPNGDKITIEYDSFGYDFNAVNSSRMRRIPSFSEKHGLEPRCDLGPSTYPAITEYLTTPSYVKAIYFAHGKLTFERNSREDLINGERLERIKLHRKTSDDSYIEERNFVFDNNYYFSASTNGNSYHPYIMGYDSQDSKRLKLQKYYETNPGGTETINNHTFDYNLVALPVKSSFSVDHWGYYNGQHSNQTFIPTNSFMDFSGANREPSSDKTIASLLKTIYYPTGGKIDFDFITTALAAGMARPGSVIERISEYDPVAEVTMIQRFEYAGVTPTYIQPVYQIHKLLFPGECDFVKMSDVIVDWSPENFYLSSETVFPFSESAMGRVAGFTNVTKYLGENGENGKSLFVFKNTFLPPRAQYTTATSSQLGFSPGSRMFFDAEAEYYNERTNGRLDSQTDYKYNETTNSFTRVKKHQNYYDTHESLIWNGYPLRSADHTFLYAVALYWYGVPVVWDRCIRTEETIYKSNEPDILEEVVYTYESSPKHYQILSQSMKGSNDKIEEVRFKYPDDYSSPGVSIQKLKDKNIVVPIEQTKWVNNKPIAGIANIYSYNSSTDLVLPNRASQIETSVGLASIVTSNNGETFDSNYKTRLNYDLYDDNGNLLQFSLKNNIYTTIIWSYLNQYPIAKIDNASYTEVGNAVSNISSTFINDLSQSNLQSYIDTKLSQLRTEVSNDLPRALITTYTYDPLIGMTSQTDPAGVTTYFEYDDFGRLKNLKDFGGNIAKSYDYHYIPQPELTVTPTSLSFSDLAQTKTFNVASNVSWSVSDNQSWISVSPTSGSNNGTVSVTVSSNSSSSRTGVVTVSENDGSGVPNQQISISQSAFTPSLALSISTLTVPGHATMSFNITSNSSWSIWITYGVGNSGWLSVDPDTGSGNSTITVQSTSDGPSGPPYWTATIHVAGPGSLYETIECTKYY
jgi:YD repeat-containing protein